MTQTAPVDSVCVFCGSSNTAPKAFLDAAASFGEILAKEGVRLVYGGGRVGLMGACARATHKAGGAVLGVIPEFLQVREVIYDEVETRVVASMHERKTVMFEESEAFVVLPGGIGTLEEVIELMSWRRLTLHTKPIVFLDQDGYCRPLFDLITHTIDHRLTPADFAHTWRAVDRVEDILPAVRAMAASPAPVSDITSLT